MSGLGWGHSGKGSLPYVQLTLTARLNLCRHMWLAIVFKSNQAVTAIKYAPLMYFLKTHLYFSFWRHMVLKLGMWRLSLALSSYLKWWTKCLFLCRKLQLLAKQQASMTQMNSLNVFYLLTNFKMYPPKKQITHCNTFVVCCFSQ